MDWIKYSSRYGMLRHEIWIQQTKQLQLMMIGVAKWLTNLHEVLWSGKLGKVPNPNDLEMVEKVWITNIISQF